jgi:hypothetical protein
MGTSTIQVVKKKRFPLLFLFMAAQVGKERAQIYYSSENNVVSQQYHF